MEITQEMIDAVVKNLDLRDKCSMAAPVAQPVSMPVSRPWKKEAKMKRVYNPIDDKLEFELVVE